MALDLKNIRRIQERIANQVRTEDSQKLTDVKLLGAFDVAYQGHRLVCAAVILDYPSFKVIEKKTVVTSIPMKYVPGLLAFREGPAILQLYYDLEYDPDIIFIDGNGIAHPEKAGLASYVGVELEKPTIGVAKTFLDGEVRDDNTMVIHGEIRGTMVRTKEFANPLCVSPGHLISLETSAEWVKKTIVPPHKKPEPLHIASRLAKVTAEQLEDERSEPLPQESASTEEGRA